MKPGPYLNINEDWFWNRHATFIKHFKKKPKIDNPERNSYYEKIRTIERDLLQRVDGVLKKEDSIGETEFVKKIAEINNYAWKKSEEMII
jgi:hypothetical protein